MLVDVSWTWLAVHRGNKLINRSSGHCQPFWINGNRAYNDHDQMMTFAWPGEPFGRDHWPVDSWLTGHWRLDRIGTMASSNAVLVRRQVRGAVPRNLRDPHRSHTNPEQGPSQWESSWAPGCPLGMWAGEIVGHVLMLTVSLLSWLTLADSVAPLNAQGIR